MKVTIYTAPKISELEEELNDYLTAIDDSTFVDIKMLYEPRFESESGHYSEQWTAVVIQKGNLVD